MNPIFRRPYPAFPLSPAHCTMTGKEQSCHLSTPAPLLSRHIPCSPIMLSPPRQRRFSAPESVPPIPFWSSRFLPLLEELQEKGRNQREPRTREVGHQPQNDIFILPSSGGARQLGGFHKERMKRLQHMWSSCRLGPHGCRTLYPGIIHAFFCTCRAYQQRGRYARHGMDERLEGSRIVFPALEKRSREVWMQSEPRRPDGEWGHPSRCYCFRRSVPTRRRSRGEEGAADRDSSRRSSDPNKTV